MLDHDSIIELLAKEIDFKVPIIFEKLYEEKMKPDFSQIMREEEKENTAIPSRVLEPY